MLTSLDWLFTIGHTVSEFGTITWPSVDTLASSTFSTHKLSQYGMKLGTDQAAYRLRNHENDGVERLENAESSPQALLPFEQKSSSLHLHAIDLRKQHH